MGTKIKGVTLFMYFDGKRKPIVKPTTTEKAVEFMNLLEQNPVPGKEKIDKIVYTDTLFVGVYNKGNFDYDEPNEYFSIEKPMLKLLEQLSDNGIGFLESKIISPNTYTAEYNDVYDSVIMELSDAIDEGSVNSRAIAGAIKRAFNQFNIAYDAATDIVNELKRDISVYVKSALPVMNNEQSLHKVYEACSESEKDFKALQQAAQDSYQALVDNLDDEALDALDDNCDDC